MHQTSGKQQNRPADQPHPTEQHRNPTNLMIKLVNGDSHTIQAEYTEAVVASVGNADATMIAFHASGKRIYVPCRAIVSMMEAVPSEPAPPSTWFVDR